MAFALSSLNNCDSPIFNFLLGIIKFYIHAGVFQGNTFYIQSIGSGISLFSEINQISLLTFDFKSNIISLFNGDSFGSYGGEYNICYSLIAIKMNNNKYLLQFKKHIINIIVYFIVFYIIFNALFLRSIIDFIIHFLNNESTICKLKSFNVFKDDNDSFHITPIEPKITPIINFNRYFIIGFRIVVKKPRIKKSKTKKNPFFNWKTISKNRIYCS